MPKYRKKTRTPSGVASIVSKDKVRRITEERHIEVLLSTPVSHGTGDGLVVLEPAGSQTLMGHVGGTGENRNLSS